MPKIIGLTGGIGSGKTTVAKMFAQLGVPIYIADDEANKIVNSSKNVHKEIIALLGEEAYVNKVLNRKFVADKIFQDKELLKAVNEIIHPKVAKHFKKWATSQKTLYVIKEAAILFEYGNYKNCDAVILVTAPKKARIERVLLRGNITQQEIEQRMGNQWSDEKKETLADFVIQNIDLKSTQIKVKELHNFFMNSLLK